MNVLSHEQQIQVLHMLVEGCSLRSITRLTKIHRTTVMKLMVRAGEYLREFLNVRMHRLHLSHIQCDEIWTFVAKKQARLTEQERNNDAIGDQYLYIALDQTTKLVPSFTIGKRNREMTESFMLDLSARIVAPRSTEPGFRPQVSTDGWAAYPGAVDLAFADTVRHGVLIKDYQNSEQPGRYGPPELMGETRIPMSPDVDPVTICTSHVERHNLSIRTFMRRFTRLALGFSKKLENLEAATNLYVAHYNYCRWHGTLNKTPAMAAGLTGHPWTMEELLSEAGMFIAQAA
jgi:IS1 family transposase